MNGNLQVDEVLRDPPFARVGKQVAVGFIMIFFIANQFPHTTTIKEIAFYGSLILFASLLLSRKIVIHFDSPITIPAAIFIVIVLIGSVFAINKNNTIDDLYSHLIRYILIWIIIISFIESNYDFEVLITVVVLSTTFFCIYNIVDLYIIKNMPFSTRLLTGSQEITTNLVGINIILSVNLAYYKLKSSTNRRAKGGYSLAIIVLLFSLFAAQARSGFLALVLSALIVFLSNRNVIKLCVVLTLLAVAACYSPVGTRLTTQLSTDIRIQHMLLCLEVVKDHPLTGIGFGMQTFARDLDLVAYNKRVEEKYRLPVYADSILTDPHNLYTDIAVRSGIVGFSAFIHFIYTVYRTLLRMILANEKEGRDLSLALLASLSSFMFIGLFEPVFSHPFEAIFCFIFALTHILWKQTMAIHPKVLPNQR